MISGLVLDLTGLYVALGLAAAAALVATPGFWRLGAGLSRWRRALLAVLAALGLVGISGVWLSFELRDREIAPFALVLTGILQVLVLPVLIWLGWRRRRAERKGQGG